MRIRRILNKKLSIILAVNRNPKFKALAKYEIDLINTITETILKKNRTDSLFTIINI